MTDQDRDRWNQKHTKNPGSSLPSRIVEDFYHLAFSGNALDIACGNGRNSIFLAAKNFQVDAIDISSVAMTPLKAYHPNLTPICQDLDTWQMPLAAYHLIVNIHFLDRRMFPMIMAGLKPGGVLIYESFVGEKQEPYCLAPNELLHAFLPLRILYYLEREIDDQAHRFNRMVSLVGVKPVGSP